MDDQTLVSLMSELARLLSRRSATPRKAALRIAHHKLRAFAEARRYSEEWCDGVLLTFLGARNDLAAA
jgi:hypothetical protein